jgi:aerobic-type carbon monoxide dehydrogenase small subunit (CoxS/CutS family)
MILRATSLLGEKRDPSEDQIVAAMEGNLCRCGTYPRILEAVKRASRQPTQGASQ